MPVSYTFLDDGRGTIWTGWGRLTGAELIDKVKEATACWKSAAPFLYGFYDYSSVTEMDISTPQVRELASIGVEASKYRPDGAISAIYATSDLSFGLARMWQAFTDQPDWDTAVFRERSAAVAWLKERVATRFGFRASLQ